ncbi:MAG: TIGR04283 family arsenosugar biosynthesis glycosyltransferase [Aquabacterium sp.]|jgi:rSAM/selenodomain-associated transferase 2
MSLSVVVPMLNEAAALPALLAHLRQLQADGAEVLLVDGGSTDDSAMLARSAGFTVVEAERGRARQMNAGARRTHGDVLLFLHADTRLPDGAVQQVMQALAAHPGAQAAPPHGRVPVWGRFDVHITGQSHWLRVVARMMNLRSRLTGIATGDQAMFVRRSVFDACGGFPEQPLMEDIELSRRLKRLSRPACLRARATTSGRRWESRGVWRTIVLMWRLRLAYWLGASAESIAKAYR